MDLSGGQVSPARLLVDTDNDGVLDGTELGLSNPEGLNTDPGDFIADADGLLVGNVFNVEFLNYRAANFDPIRHGYFHYVVMPHGYGGSSSSGYAELPATT